MKHSILIMALMMSAGLLAGCETTQQFAEEPLAPVVEPVRPLITPVNDIAEEAVSVKKSNPFGFNTTVSLADQKQIRVAF